MVKEKQDDSLLNLAAVDPEEAKQIMNSLSLDPSLLHKPLKQDCSTGPAGMPSGQSAITFVSTTMETQDITETNALGPQDPPASQPCLPSAVPVCYTLHPSLLQILIQSDCAYRGAQRSVRCPPLYHTCTRTAPHHCQAPMIQTSSCAHSIRMHLHPQHHLLPLQHPCSAPSLALHHHHQQQLPLHLQHLSLCTCYPFSCNVTLTHLCHPIPQLFLSVSLCQPSAE